MLCFRTETEVASARTKGIKLIEGLEARISKTTLVVIFGTGTLLLSHGYAFLVLNGAVIHVRTKRLLSVNGNSGVVALRLITDIF